MRYGSSLIWKLAFLAEEIRAADIVDPTIHCNRGGPDYSLRIASDRVNRSDPPLRTCQASACGSAHQHLQPIFAPANRMLRSKLPVRSGGSRTLIHRRTKNEFHLAPTFQKAAPVPSKWFRSTWRAKRDVRLVVDRAIDDAAGVKNLGNGVATAEEQSNVDRMPLFGCDPRSPILNFTPLKTANIGSLWLNLDTGRSLGTVSAIPNCRFAPDDDDCDCPAYHVYPHKDVNISRPIGSNLPLAGAMNDPGVRPSRKSE